MRKVLRLPKPQSLEEHGKQWTEELLHEIESCGSYAMVKESCKDRYRQPDVKETLEEMYHGHCCYCESIIGVSSYGRIEHLRPKALPEFHKLSFEWNNLHWSCEICNTEKRNKWDYQYPILDPSTDDIEQFLRLNLQTGEYEALDEDQRARTTIRHTGMNRPNLVKARQKRILLWVKRYKKTPLDNRREFISEWEEVIEDFDFPSLYAAVIEQIEGETKTT